MRQQIAALRASEEKLRRIFESVTDVIVVTDLSDVIIEVNAEAARRYGDHSTIIGKSGYSVVDPRDFEKAKRQRRQTLAEGIVKDVRYTLVQADGSKFPAEVTTSVLKNSSGNTIGIISITRDITRRKCAEARLRALSRRLVEIREEERRGIGRELHDQTSQSLTALKLLLERIASSSPQDVNNILSQAQEVLQELLTQVRDLSLDLWPSILDQLGLLPALLWHFDRYTAQTHIEVDSEHSSLPKNLRPPVKVAAYRIVQEALTNVARHAQVNKVKVRVWTERKKLFLLIEDEGVGFNPDVLPVSGSNGLQGMRERARMLGGRVTVESTVGIGTSVLAELPFSTRSKRNTQQLRQ